MMLRCRRTVAFLHGQQGQSSVGLNREKRHNDLFCKNPLGGGLGHFQAVRVSSDAGALMAIVIDVLNCARGSVSFRRIA